ncbi:MAG: electron transport complex subunit RsxG [Candidatus Thiodiazotropha endolucinida]|uniref:Ion-translocating oxidoreductase complex subunit G n=1 Tax=Candidatus Thiodiazotropha taylori TaxID=2792791 RepID=A0A9E4TS49_9GAMM|nr:electron transport complex subunit RsxG [Candidatus Thiodiazotropha taylori]MCW4236062.1 electron transport complex subunit RsxG [Candidatus Thiodiazotropha endolucinida]
MGTPVEPQYRKRIGYQAMLLGGFSTLATALLVAGNIATKDVIAERQREDMLASLNEVVTADNYDNNLLENPLTLERPDGKPVSVYRGTLGNQVTIMAYEMSSQGYAGEIRLIMGLDAQGKVLGVRVLSHTETPGLGDKIELEKDNWILAFNGLSLGNPPRDKWRVKKDGGQFDAFSGATITPRAVLKAIEDGLVFYQENYTALRQPPVINTSTVTHSGVNSHEQ